MNLVFNESFPGQPEYKDLQAAVDVPFKEAQKDHDERIKEAEEAFEANKEAIDLVSGDNTKEKDGKVKSDTLKKMHLSESLFDNDFNVADDFIQEFCRAVEEVCIEYQGLGLSKEDIELAFERFMDTTVEDVIVECANTENLEECDQEPFQESLKKSLNEDMVDEDPQETILLKYPRYLDLYSVEDVPEGKRVDFEIDGDWKHDHLAFVYWMKKNAEDLLGYPVKYVGETPIDDSEDDTYKSIHTYIFPYKDMTGEPDVEEEQPVDEPTQDEETEFDGQESLKFHIAKEQLKRYNEGKMPSDWNPQVYLENLTKRNHISTKQKQILSEAFLTK